MKLVITTNPGIEDLLEEELREALSILTKIVEWYDNKPEVRAVISRAFLAPLSFIRKKHGIEQKIRYVYNLHNTRSIDRLLPSIPAQWRDDSYVQRGHR